MYLDVKVSMNSKIILNHSNLNWDFIARSIILKVFILTCFEDYIVKLFIAKDFFYYFYLIFL